MKTMSVRNGFIWHTADGHAMLVDDMETRHLFHAFKMLANTILPEHLQVNSTARMYQAGDGYIHAAMEAIEAELAKRKVPGLWQRELAALKLNLSLMK